MMDKLLGLPVSGYRAQSQTNVDRVNANKELEERVLRVIDSLQGIENADPRWLAEARAHIEIGFMALNRAVFRPARAVLPGD